jgi:hypothetical protein
MDNPLTVRRIYEALIFAFNEHIEDVSKDTNSVYSKKISFKDFFIEMEMSLKFGLQISFCKKLPGYGYNYKTVVICYEPFLENKYDQPVSWMEEGFWVDIVKKFVLSVEKEKKKMLDGLDHEFRLEYIMKG